MLQIFTNETQDLTLIYNKSVKKSKDTIMVTGLLQNNNDSPLIHYQKPKSFLGEKKYFDRDTVLKLTGMSDGQLSRIVALKWIDPVRKGTSLRAGHLYTWLELLELKAIAKLRKKVSFSRMKDIRQTLLELGYESFRNDSDKVLIATKTEVFLIDKTELQPKILQLMGCGNTAKGQLVLAVLPIDELVKEIEETAKANNISYIHQKRYSERQAKKSA